MTIDNLQKTSSKKLLNIYISCKSYADVVFDIIQLGKQQQSSYVCTINVHMLIEAHKNKNFENVVNQADIRTADGMPVVKALKMLYSIKQDRIAGMDLLPDLVKNADSHNLSVFFYGSTADVLNRIEQKLKIEFPKLRSKFYAPPFRTLTVREEQEVIEMINLFCPHILLVALGCPKQETWMANMKGRINAVMIGVGGAFPVYADMQKRAPIWMQKHSLEWIFRLYQEPFRLLKRYLTTNSIFFYLLIKELLFKKNTITR